MVASIPTLGLLCLRKASRVSLTSIPRQLPPRCCHLHQRRKFSYSPILRKKLEDEQEDGVNDEAEAEADEISQPPTQVSYEFSLDDLEPEERTEYLRKTSEEQEKYRNEVIEAFNDLDSSMNDEFGKLSTETSKDMPYVSFEQKRVKSGFFNDSEEEPELTGEDEEFEGDDLNELGHAELDRHREMRHYARLAAWEMPLLSKLAKPFTPPTKEQLLRFRYTTYMGEEHPAANKIVLEFGTQDLPDLTEPQRIKFIKLVGPRYNPETDLVKMSCESFETQAQNKRYLGDLVETLLAEAKDSADMFEDVPLDFRHHKFKPRPKFPDSWRLTEDKMRQLETERRERMSLQDEKMGRGLLVDGSSIVEQAMASLPAGGMGIGIGSGSGGGVEDLADRVLVEPGRRRLPTRP